MSSDAFIRTMSIDEGTSAVLTRAWREGVRAKHIGNRWHLVLEKAKGPGEMSDLIVSGETRR